MNTEKTGNLIAVFTAMVALWKWVHRKEPLMSRGEYSREGMKIEITEGGFPDSKEMEKRLP